jgi:predicted nucleic acid-binding protein
MPPQPPDERPLIVVSNTTPISELAKVGRLELLRDVYNRILVPEEVYNELTAGSHPAVAAIQSAAWIERRSVTDRSSVQALHAATRLGLGECGAILLAEQLAADRLLIDDRTARREATSRGLSLGGTLGTLLIARQHDLIASVKELLDDLMAHGTRIHPRLRREILELAGEHE